MQCVCIWDCLLFLFGKTTPSIDAKYNFSCLCFLEWEQAKPMKAKNVKKRARREK